MDLFVFAGFSERLAESYNSNLFGQIDFVRLGFVRLRLAVLETSAYITYFVSPLPLKITESVCSIL